VAVSARGSNAPPLATAPAAPSLLNRMFNVGASAAPKQPTDKGLSSSSAGVALSSRAREDAALAKAAQVLEIRRQFMGLLVQAMAAVSSTPFASPRLQDSGTTQTKIDDGPFRSILDIFCASYAKSSIGADGMLVAIPLALARLAARARAQAQCISQAIGIEDAKGAASQHFSQAELRRVEFRNSLLLLASQVRNVSVPTVVSTIEV
jgi:hypothetical protein